MRTHDRRNRVLAALDAFAPPGRRAADVRIVRAPGRVNLIGEHTDYNDGFVLPAAIDLDTWIAFRPRRDGVVRVVSRQAGPGEFRIGDLAPERHDASSSRWVDYVAGVAWSLREAGLPVHGLDGVVDSTIPLAAGLSSSAALENASACALLPPAAVPEPAALAALAQRAEREYVGVNCGIMDQFASAAGKAGQAMLLDCRSLEIQYAALPRGVAVVVCDTGSPRELAASAYNERRAECGRAVALLSERLPEVASLRDVRLAELLRYRDVLPDPIGRRAEHVVAENERVPRAATALAAGDLAEVGRLFAESHESLRTLYEVSSPALDTMVEIARGVAGVVGARMTGAGFGGCTVNLVLERAVPALTAAVERDYYRRTGFEPHVYRVELVDGAGQLGPE